MYASIGRAAWRFFVLVSDIYKELIAAGSSSCTCFFKKKNKNLLFFASVRKM